MLKRLAGLVLAFLFVASAAHATCPAYTFANQVGNVLAQELDINFSCLATGNAGTVNGIVKGDGAGNVAAVTIGTGLTFSGGALSVTSSGVTAGTYLSPTSVTVNVSGQITAIVGNCGQQCTAPNLLKFGPPTVINYYDPQPSGLIDVTDNFGSTGTFTQITGSGSPTLSVASNIGTISSVGAGQAWWQETSDSTLTAPQMFNAIQVTGHPSSGTTFDQVVVGACKDSTHYVETIYDNVGHHLYVYLSNGGGNAQSSQLSITLTAPFTLGLSMVGNSLSAWYNTGSGWVYAENLQGTSTLDFTGSTALSGWKTCYGLSNGGGTATWNVSTLQGGRFGGVIMRDIKPVVNPDWTTYQPGSNLIYFTASVGDPPGVQLGANSGTSQGVFTLNVNTLAITETGVICVNRSSHVYCADAAGNIIRHSNGDREVLLSSWSDYVTSSVNVGVEYLYIAAGGSDILTNNLSVLSSMTTLTLPKATGDNNVYDPALAYDAANNRYLIAYTNGLNSGSPVFFPALAYASTPTGTWTSIGIDSNLVGNWEGTSFANVSGIIYELAGGPRAPAISTQLACTTSRVYNESFAYQGQLLGATFIGSTNPSAVNCSHPTLFQHPDGLHMVLFTFNGNEFLASTGGSTGQPMIEISTP